MLLKSVRLFVASIVTASSLVAVSTVASAQDTQASAQDSQASAQDVAGPVVNQTPTLPAVDLDAYAGLWYEAARTPNPFQDNKPEIFGTTFSECLDTSVVYTVTPLNTIDLVNSCQRVDPISGFEYTESIEGGAFAVPDTDGQLKVAFGPSPWPFFIVLLGFGGDYWVYDLGPIVNGSYQWAIVSGPNPATESNFILTRSPTVSDSVRAEIIAAATAAGIPVDQLVERRR